MNIQYSKDVFQIDQWIWKISGLKIPKNHRNCYFFCIFIFNTSVTLIYPLHLVIGLFQNQTKDEMFRSLAIAFTNVLCSIKFISIWYNIKNLWLIDNILTTLDRRIQSKDEKMHFQKSVRICKLIAYVTAILYFTAWVTPEISVFISDERFLMFPAWIPLDWKQSAVIYWIANAYQFIGIALQITVTYASDTYPSLSLAMFSAHIRIVAIRMSKLGTDPSKSQQDNNKEFRMSIKDHKRLIRIYKVLSSVLSKGMFFQLLVTGINICSTLIYLVFYADRLFSIIYYATYLVILLLQIFPTCYFGSVFETEWFDLPYSLFSCNWIDQDREFKQNMIILSQRGFQRNSFFCMGFFRINLDSFFVTMKSAYSLLAVIMQAK